MRTIKKYFCMQSPDDGTGVIKFNCPKCGHEQELVLDEAKENYDIDNEGRVFPDFVCMTPSRSCRFMDTIVLENWK